MRSWAGLILLLAAGVLVGAASVGAVLVRSGLEVTVLQREAGSTAPPAPAGRSPEPVGTATPLPGSHAPRGTPPEPGAPPVPGTSPAVPPTAMPGPLPRAGGSEVARALLRIGPVSSDLAAEIVGELTLAGFTARVRTVPSQGRQSQVVTIGPHPEPMIAGAAARLRARFPQVRFSIIPAR